MRLSLISLCVATRRSGHRLLLLAGVIRTTLTIQTVKGISPPFLLQVQDVPIREDELLAR